MSEPFDHTQYGTDAVTPAQRDLLIAAAARQDRFAANYAKAPWYDAMVKAELVASFERDRDAICSMLRENDRLTAELQAAKLNRKG